MGGYPESGVVACAAPVSKLERTARLARQLAEFDPDELIGPGRVLRGLLDHLQRQRHDDPSSSRVRHVDLGIGPEVARLAMGDSKGSIEPQPYYATVLLRQPRENRTIAYAHGCALFLAWAMKPESSSWTPTMLRELMLAIAVPATTLLRLEKMAHDPAHLGQIFVCPTHVILERLDVVHGRKRSGERPALRLATTTETA